MVLERHGGIRKRNKRNPRIGEQVGAGSLTVLKVCLRSQVFLLPLSALLIPSAYPDHLTASI